MVIVRLLMMLFLTTNVFADVMNLNEFMPTRMEDSKGTQAGALEFQLASDFQKEDQDNLIFRENIRYGVSDRLQLEGLANQFSGGDERSNGEFQLGGQYVVIPQLGVSPMIAFPTGKGEDGIDTHLRFNNSYTLSGSPNSPRAQLHLNIDWAHNEKPKSDERDNHYLYVVGVSYKYNDSGAVLLDILREEEELKDEEQNIFEVGTQYDIGRDYMVGLGAGVGFGDESPHWNSILSIVKKVSL
jgi:hypothetical protein